MKKDLLIFGSNGALGSGVTKVLLQKNFDNIYLFNRKNDLKTSDNKIKQIIIEDLSVEENVQKVFKNVQRDSKAYYFLFSTIGGYFGGVPTWETKVDDFDKMMNVNMKINFLIAKHFVSIVKESSGGSICFTSAYAGNYSAPDNAVYGASKASLSHLVKSLAEEGQNIKLSVNAIAPYIIDTHANRNWIKTSNYDDWMKAEEIGELIFSVFNNFNYLSGNVIELKHRFNV